MKHTILGAGGPVSNALTRELENNNQHTHLVSRKPLQTKGNTTWAKADLTSHAEVRQAAKGSDIIYLCAGLIYDKTIWQQQWPQIMQNVIDVAKENNSRLIFFDNVYMYGQVNGPMTENTPYNPCSAKGEVRAKIATQLMDEAKTGNIKASIARAADFYGSEQLKSFVDMMVLDKYAKKQKAQWIGKPELKHSFTYVPDAGKGMYLLGQHPESDNQIWHMPTAPALSGRAFIELAAKVFNVEPKYSTINKLMMRLAGLFSRDIRSSVEMYYQYDKDYIFDSTKFERAFSFKATNYETGLKEFSKFLTTV
jgi:nucleoside-diphosphate-sugar epimerase